MKLREGWKRFGNSWKYNVTPMGYSDAAVLQFVELGVKKYQARYPVICVYGSERFISFKLKKFASREEAFLFCEEKCKETKENT